MNKIPIVNLAAQYKYLKKDIQKKWKQLCDATNFILGEEVEKFEEEFAQFCQRSHAIGVSSGTSALHLALEAVGCRGGEVITTPFTFISTCEAIIHAGGSVKWVDIDPKTYNINPSEIESAITPDTKAILPVHLYGHMADMDTIMGISQKNNIPVIEDCAQAHGAEYKGKKAGSIGSLGCFSFYPGKNLGAYGDAGCVVCDDMTINLLIKRLRTHGSLDKYYHTEIGYNYRMDTLQAAVLRIKLKYLSKWNEARKKNASLYNENLKGLPITTPFVAENAEHVYHQYVILVPQRDKLMEKLKKDGISTAVHYPIPLHLQPSFEYLGYKEGSFPVAEKIAKSVLSLPMFPELTPNQINYISEKIKEFYG